jgi:hypothetical protein
MVESTHNPEAQRQTGWSPSLRALWSLCWRLSVMLVFFIGALCCALLDRWLGVLGCIAGFIIAALIIRRVSTVEHEAASSDSIVFL